jgi:hypothetical protein
LGLAAFFIDFLSPNMENFIRGIAEKKIVQIGIDRFKNTKRGFVDFSRTEKADKLLNDIENNPHVFVLACLMDRQIPAEKAWGIPQIVLTNWEPMTYRDWQNMAKRNISIFLQNINRIDLIPIWRVYFTMG